VEFKGGNSLLFLKHRFARERKTVTNGVTDKARDWQAKERQNKLEVKREKSVKRCQNLGVKKENNATTGRQIMASVQGEKRVMHGIERSKEKNCLKQTNGD